MVKRVVISPTIFKLSKAGFDADTAADVNILFDGMSGDPYAGVYLSGTTQVNDGTWTSFGVGNVYAGQLTYTRYLKTISFAKTFSQPPQIIWALLNYNNTALGAFDKYSNVNYANNFGSNYVTGLSTFASCTTTEALLRVDVPGSNSSGTWRFAYMVFQT